MRAAPSAYGVAGFGSVRDACSGMTLWRWRGYDSRVDTARHARLTAPAPPAIPPIRGSLITTTVREDTTHAHLTCDPFVPRVAPYMHRSTPAAVPQLYPSLCWGSSRKRAGRWGCWASGSLEAMGACGGVRRSHKVALLLQP